MAAVAGTEDGSAATTDAADVAGAPGSASGAAARRRPRRPGTAPAGTAGCCGALGSEGIGPGVVGVASPAALSRASSSCSVSGVPRRRPLDGPAEAGGADPSWSMSISFSSPGARAPGRTSTEILVRAGAPGPGVRRHVTAHPAAHRPPAARPADPGDGSDAVAAPRAGTAGAGHGTIGP